MLHAKRNGADVKSVAFGVSVIVCEPRSAPSTKSASSLPTLVNVSVCGTSKLEMPEATSSSSSSRRPKVTSPLEKSTAVGPVYGSVVSEERTKRTPRSPPGGKWLPSPAPSMVIAIEKSAAPHVPTAAEAISKDWSSVTSMWCARTVAKGASAMALL